MNTKQTLKGFTIIEVVLVLAIAGLIFLMVFVALPALQSGQRDTARKNDVSAVSNAITTYSSVNRGSLPDSAEDLGDGPGDGYLDAVSDNITEVTLSSISSQTNATAEDGVVAVYLGARCGEVGGTDKTTVTLERGTARQYVLVTLLEAGGGVAFCQES